MATQVGNILGPIGPQGVQGGSGPPGKNAYTTTSASFTVPAKGSTVTVNVTDTSWVVVGQMVYIDQAGGAGQAGTLQVTAKTSGSLTLLTPS
jgi:hypothetical protein